MQLLVPVALIQQDLGICLDRVRAPQPLGLSGPMALDHLMTTGIQDADLILPQALLMNMREVPSYYDSRANNTTKELQSGSMFSVKKPTCLPTIGLLQLIVKQVPRRSGMYLNLEPNVKILFSDIKDNDIPYEIDNPFCNAKTTITVRQSKKIEDRGIGKTICTFVEKEGTSVVLLQ